MTDCGRSPNGSGYSAEPEPSCTVSAVPVSIPNAVLDALRFYASEKNWKSCTTYMCGHGAINCNVMGDGGAKARSALAGVGVVL